MCKPQGQKPVTNWTWVYDMICVYVDRGWISSSASMIFQGQVIKMPIKDILPMLIDS